jgi:hypothetical protein
LAGASATVKAMTDSWPCPLCGTDVEGTGTQSRVGNQPPNQHIRCPGCEAALVRRPEAADPSWSVNQDDKSPGQCRIRLEAAARRLDLDFSLAQDDSGQRIWRCRLSEKVAPNDRSGRTTIRAWGNGSSSDEALEEAAYDAAVNSLI